MQRPVELTLSSGCRRAQTANRLLTCNTNNTNACASAQVKERGRLPSGPSSLTDAALLTRMSLVLAQLTGGTLGNICSVYGSHLAPLCRQPSASPIPAACHPDIRGFLRRPNPPKHTHTHRASCEQLSQGISFPCCAPSLVEG